MPTRHDRVNAPNAATYTINLVHRLSRLGRGLIVCCVVVSILIPAALIAGHLSTGPTSAIAADLKVAGGVGHSPWYGMSVIRAHPAFHAATTTPKIPPPAMNTAAGILVDIDTGEILWSRNPHQPLPPASTTKIMTALLILGNYSPDQMLTITPDALNQAGDETRMGLRAGEKLTVRELLTGMLLVSANDAATALAVDTVGRDRFIGAMNAQEAALGLTDSHFSTPVGLDAPDHHLSAYDEAAIASVAVDRFSLFRQLVDTQGADLPATSTHQEYGLGNLNFLLHLYPAAVGIKPGYTGDAGPCLVGMAVRGPHRLISVLMNAPLDYHQSSALLDWGFAVEGMPPLIPPSPSPSPTAHH